MPLTVIIVAESDDLAGRLIDELHRAGFEVRSDRVASEEELSNALMRAPPDVVIATDNAPALPFVRVVAAVRESAELTPVIVVCEDALEDEAVAVMREGARDVVTWQRLVRLAPALERELEGGRVHRDRLSAERALVESEKRFRAMVEDQTDFVARWTPDGRFLFVNRAFGDFLGSSIDDLIGARSADDLRPGDRRLMDEVLSRITPDNPVVVSEPKIVRPDGEVAWHEWINRGVFDEHNVLVEVQSVGRDVTERRKAEEAERQRMLLVEVLRDTAAALNSTLDLDEVFDRILANIGWVIPHNASAIFFAEGGEARVIRLRGWEDQGIEQVPERVPLTDIELGALTAMVASGKPIVIQDTENDAQWNPGTRRLQWVKSFAAAPLFDESRSFGVLALFCDRPDYFTDVHLELLEGFASQAASASRNARLFESVSASRHKLRELSARIIDAQEDERRRISKELHDGVAQTMTAVIINAELMLSRVDQDSDDPTIVRLGDVTRLAKEALTQIRTLSQRLRPAMLDELGLVPTLRWFAKRFADWSDLEVDLNLVGIEEERLEPVVETTLYRVIQEALTNVVRHADATRVEIEVIRKPGRAVVRIEDDGVGFDPEAIGGGDGHRSGLGLVGIEERLSTLGGSFSVGLSDVGGARLDAEIPLYLEVDDRDSLHEDSSSPHRREIDPDIA